MLSLVEWALELDRRGGLGALFKSPGGLRGKEEAAILAEEGWILGAG